MIADTRKPLLTCVTFGLVVFGLLCLYAGAYYANVRLIALDVSGHGPWQRYPAYKYGGAAAHAFFAPAEWVDSRIRRNAWEYDFDDPDGWQNPDDVDPLAPFY